MALQPEVVLWVPKFVAESPVAMELGMQPEVVLWVPEFVVELPVGVLLVPASVLVPAWPLDVREGLAAVQLLPLAQLCANRSL